MKKLLESKTLTKFGNSEFADKPIKVGQLYSEFREFLPKNNVEYFVSYYSNQKKWLYLATFSPF